MSDKLWISGSNTVAGLYLKQSRVVNDFYTWVERGGNCIYSTPSGRWCITNDARDFYKGDGFAHSEKHDEKPPNNVTWDKEITVLDEAQQHQEKVQQRESNADSDRISLIQSSLQLLTSLKNRELKTPSDECIRCQKSISEHQDCVYHPGLLHKTGFWSCCSVPSTQPGCVTVKHTSIRTYDKICVHCCSHVDSSVCIPRVHSFNEKNVISCSDCCNVQRCSQCHSTELRHSEVTEATDCYEFDCDDCGCIKPIEQVIDINIKCSQCGNSTTIDKCLIEQHQRKQYVGVNDVDTMSKSSTSTVAVSNEGNTPIRLLESCVTVSLLCDNTGCRRPFKKTIPQVTCSACNSPKLSLRHTTSRCDRGVFSCDNCSGSETIKKCNVCFKEFNYKKNLIDSCLNCGISSTNKTTKSCIPRKHEWNEGKPILKRCSKCGYENSSTNLPCNDGGTHTWIHSPALDKIISPRKIKRIPKHYSITIKDISKRADATKNICQITGKTGQGKALRTVVYCYSHYTAEDIYRRLLVEGISVYCIHGGMSQNAIRESWNGFISHDEEKSKILTTVSLFEADLSKVDIIIHNDIQYPLFDNLRNFSDVRPCCGLCLTSTIISTSDPVLEVSGAHHSNTLEIFNNCLNNFTGISLMVVGDRDKATLNMLKESHTIEEAPTSISMANLLRGDNWFSESSILCRS